MPSCAAREKNYNMAANAKYSDLSYGRTEPKDLTLGEKLGALIAAAKLVAALPVLILQALFRGRSKSGKPWVYQLRNRILHFLLCRVDNRQINLASPRTATRIAMVSKRLKVDVTVEEIAQGGKIHWWGQRKGQKVLLHIHGGGYNLPIGEHHLAFYHKTQQRLKAKGMDVDLAFLEYSLTPVARYPTQLVQSVEALRYLLETCKYDPANIIISGDSAGGCLVLSVISHILHNHPAIAPLTLSAPLGGVISISPWTSFDTSAASFKRPTGFDVVLPSFVDVWSRWLVDHPSEPRSAQLPPTDAYTEPLAASSGGKIVNYTWDEYNQPNQAKAGWWAGFPVRKTQILIGEDETLRDSIVELVSVFQEGATRKRDGKGGTEVQVVMCEGEIHTECLYDTFIPGDLPAPGKMAESLWAMCEETFQ
ncbi:hypothetical protein Dda_1708 [Drechslerella dactyloides]|uniref:Alpha/beta hydrolase fold-3 domain-containing protein n=1 Tax=Drechslerella dactyloides TaxID=74499 RepID=A0AAD6J2E3_DREDA|nr:hypothetical protein Dda_1708 [Drechslerella dactyloides]